MAAQLLGSTGKQEARSFSPSGILNFAPFNDSQWLSSEGSECVRHVRIFALFRRCLVLDTPEEKETSHSLSVVTTMMAGGLMCISPEDTIGCCRQRSFRRPTGMR